MQDILTEKDAKTKWCPMVRPNNSILSKTVDGDYIRVGNCIASECMAWRLAHKDAADGTERGFCGAFGTPRHT